MVVEMALGVGVKPHEFIVNQFHDLFEGNPSVFGSESGGSYKGAVRLLIGDHLRGTRTPIGVYPIHANQVKWGCVDFDEGDEESFVHARNLVTVLSEFNVKGQIERSRSKGYHVWVFAEDWGEAAIMRRALIVACDLVGAPSREVNPKQEWLELDQVGNYVRLPYPGGLRQNHVYNYARRVMVSPSGNAQHVCSWLEMAHHHRAKWADLRALADLYKRPAPKTHIAYTVDPFADVDVTEAERRLLPLIRHIYNYGPKDGMDRSSALWKLACMIAEDGRHKFKEALDLMTVADAEWGKFLPRADGELRLYELLDKAWRDRATIYEGV